MAGCTAIVTQKDVPRYAINAALTHTVVREGEVQLLRGLMFSFRWRGEKWSDIRGSHLVSTEYRCPNRSRWRAHLRSAGLSLGLVSAMNSVVVGNLAKCILRQLSIAYFHIRV